MTEIPAHLLKRSKARKGQGDTDDGAKDDAAPGTAVSKAESSGPAQPPAIRQAAAAIPRDAEPEKERPVPAYVQAARERKKMPMWAMGIPALLLLWAYSFAGTMQLPDVEDPLFVESALLYTNQGCAGCHGAGGGGGTGYQFTDGEIYATFPEPVDQMVHIVRGSGAISGQQYGDPERPGGARIAGARNVMPAYAAISLSELELIVFHERATLGGEDTESPEYQDWMEHLREVAEEVLAGNTGEGADLEFLLSCANPDYTPGEGVGTVSEDERDTCPGPAPTEDAAASQ